MNPPLIAKFMKPLDQRASLPSAVAMADGLSSWMICPRSQTVWVCCRHMLPEKEERRHLDRGDDVQFRTWHNMRAAWGKSTAAKAR